MVSVFAIVASETPKDPVLLDLSIVFFANSDDD
jgi:hypothetical protein